MAVAMMATSRMGLTARLEVAHACQARSAFFGITPHCAHAHAARYLVRGAALEQREERRVGTVEQHVAAGERPLQVLLAAYGEIDDAEGRHHTRLRQL